VAFPHERSLVKKFEGRPFVFLGINNDPSVDIALHTQKKFNLNWRSFFDGDDSSGGGTIARRYCISGWPTTVIIDADGRKRFETHVSQEAERQIEYLLREMESKKKAS
jgi:hypothetical protein